MSLVDTRTFETYASGDPVIVDPAKNIVAVAGVPTAQSAAAIHGANGLRCHTGTAGGENVSFGATSPTGAWSTYFTLVTAGAGAAVPIAVKNGSTFLGRVRLNPTGTQFELTDGPATTTIDSTTIDYAVGQDVRVDLMYAYAAPNITLEARIFVGANVEGFVPDEVLGPGTVASSAAPNRVQVGTVNTAWAIDFDTIRQYDDNSAWPVPYLSTAALSMRPVANATQTGWTVTGASSMWAALADESDASYIISATSGTSTGKFWLGPGIVPDSSIIHIKCDITGTITSATVKIYEGATLITTKTVPVTTTMTDLTLSLTGPEVALIGDWTNLFGEIIEVA